MSLSSAGWLFAAREALVNSSAVTAHRCSREGGEVFGASLPCRIFAARTALSIRAATVVREVPS